MKQHKVWIGAMLCTLFVWAGNAQAAGPVAKRQARQLQRIEQGIDNGSLTRSEVKRLRKDQRHIAAVKRTARLDGRVTRHEARRIARLQNRASKRIYEYKHNSTRQFRPARHAYGHHKKDHRAYRPDRHCRIDRYYRGGFRGAFVRPGLSLAWNVPLD